MVLDKYILVLIILLHTHFIQGINCRRSIEKQHNIGIIGGHQISIERVPFMVSLRLNGTYHWCGGSIIHERFVLTAAHCIVPNREYKVLVGTDTVDDGGEMYEIEIILKHKDYSKETDDYDICLLKLNRPMTFGSKVNFINLADKNTKLKKQTTLNITGWGSTRPSGTISDKLLQVTVPFVSTRVCQKSYFSSLRLITPRMMCAGGHGRDSCQGDSGGPLTIGDVQVGVASFGAECGVLPGVYTKIAVLNSWIWKMIGENL